MAYQTIHTKKDGKKYVYSVEGYWDKEKKAPRNKQVCLGRLNEETGEIIPSKRQGRVAKRAAAAPEVMARAMIVGPSMILEKIAFDTGLEKALRHSLPDKWTQILSLAFFLVQKGLPLSRCEIWSTSNKHPFGELLLSRDVSGLLASINEGERQVFFSRWLKMLAEKDALFYDITSVSSYSEQNEYVRWGYNRDNEKLPQINLGLLYGQDSKLPAYYRKLPGSISDVSTLKTTVSSLDFIGQSKLTFILDRGFYSQANIDALFEAKYNFIIAAPRRKWVERLYDECRNDIVSSKNRCAVKENEVLYMVTKLHNWKGRRCYAHICFNNKKAAEEADAFTLKLMVWKNELESGTEKAGNNWAYEKYFQVKETPKRGRKVVENTEAVEAAINVYSGFSCIITTKKMGAPEALEIYRRKETVENCFDDLKNALDMKRLRIHSSAAMESRLFIQFVALIILSAVRNIKNRHDKLRGLTIREIMEAMETVSEIRFSGRYGKIITEIDPIQRIIMEAFNLTLET